MTSRMRQRRIGERLEGAVDITVGVREADARGSEPYAPTAHRRVDVSRHVS